MDNYNNQNNFNQDNWNSSGISSENVAVKTFMTNVFGWMFGALAITALTSFGFSHLPALAEILYRFRDGAIIGFTPVAYILMFAPLGLVLLM
ncbi:MAG TPA: hypothetical protein VFJ43_00645, partial [Bacteroidia bacterium]|nr:hypothetical protein [Bacteroidia bacterium]